ncbi:MAG: uncharacterized protein JWR82_23 [Blastococcus sp.]|nr:uncharacterized protein [Blastococcus sp.]
MILAAFLLVLAGAGLFVAGLVTGVTLLYWVCVAVCVVAAVLLVVARRQMTATPAAAAAPPANEPATRRTTSSTATVPAVAPATTAAESAAPAGGSPAVDGLPSDGAPRQQAAPVAELDDPPVEEVEVTDLLLVVDVTDEVLVVDERPRYHLAGCVHLVGRTPIPLPLDEAKTDGFTPCAVCEPDRNLAERVRAQRGAGNR